MFYAKISQGTLIRNLIDTFKDIVVNINLIISEKGISFQALDSSSVYLISLNLFPEGFEEYRCDKEFSLGVSINNLAKLLACGGNDDTLALFFNEDSDKLKIVFENKSKNKYI